jgi:hypothetical protein
MGRDNLQAMPTLIAGVDLIYAYLLKIATCYNSDVSTPYFFNLKSKIQNLKLSYVSPSYLSR